ncbi:hypothetical protein JMJ35_008937 [Cladonia borealis]|uniref:Extracellular mutant protein 11 C-terminal domain-containing protein n=1 Tax=Cladonia borealis TaxID=184061 RepID=A0AA39U683_9LECA|nr:hypothetical protein JMJ35_008937 [Cladonia borealis]
MAAVRQFFNPRAIPAKDDSVVPGQTEETQRKIEAKMQAMGYSISPPIPNESLSIRNVDPRPLHSKFSDVDSHQHPLLRKQSLDNTSYVTNNSFDNQYRPQPFRSQTDMSLQPGNGAADPNRRSSFYEDGESPALSPVLTQHLALRPLETKDKSFQPSHQRRRSRSATNATDEGGYYGAEKNLWDSYAKDRKHKPRQESLKGSSKPLPSTDDQRAARSSPKTQNATPSAMDPRQREATKVASSPDGSRTDSLNSLSDGGHGVSRKRSRDLDYSISQLTEMDYQKLNEESFDYIPAASNTISQRDLPDRNLSLSDQLQRVFNDRTQKDKGTRAMGFFASLTIEQYEECGDLLLDSFQTVMGKLKQARQQKRKAAQAMEEQIAKREEWVKKKRGVCELELGRLKSAGAAVVKPIKSRVR